MSKKKEGVDTASIHFIKNLPIADFLRILNMIFNQSTQLHVLRDASEKAFAAVA